MVLPARCRKHVRNEKLGSIAQSVLLANGVKGLILLVQIMAWGWVPFREFGGSQAAWGQIGEKGTPDKKGRIPKEFKYFRGPVRRSGWF
jgi:hypothetical protein